MSMQALARFIRRLWRGSPVLSAPAAPQHASAATPAHGVEAQAQLQRLSGVIRGRADRGQRALECHLTATTRLDAAGYDLERLQEELADVMVTGRARGMARDVNTAIAIAAE